MRAAKIKPLLLAALKEDAAAHDLTTKTLIPKNKTAQAEIIAKQDLVLCGIPLVKYIFNLLDQGIRLKTQHIEGARLRKGQRIAMLKGSARGILAGERVALNFLQRLSGIATLTRQYVEQVKGTQAKILDTRKTTPTLRQLERYAVKIGGGVNHRFDLKEAVMVKDNHKSLVGNISEVKKRLCQFKKKIPVIVEVESIAELKQAIALGFKWIQLDNMSLKQMRKAVELVPAKVKLEATGGITLKNVRKVAQTKVDFISIGALTHSAPAVDISLEINSKKF